MSSVMAGSSTVASTSKSNPENNYEVLMVWKSDKRAIVPSRRSDGAIGYDLHALNTVELVPYVLYTLSTGLSMRIPDGHYGQICTHPSLAAVGISVIQGTVDPGNRNVVDVVVHNCAPTVYHLHSAHPFAQLIIARASQVGVVEAVCAPSQLILPADDACLKLDA